MNTQVFIVLNESTEPHLCPNPQRSLISTPALPKASAGEQNPSLFSDLVRCIMISRLPSCCSSHCGSVKFCCLLFYQIIWKRVFSESENWRGDWKGDKKSKSWRKCPVGNHLPWHREGRITLNCHLRSSHQWNCLVLCAVAAELAGPFVGG